MAEEASRVAEPGGLVELLPAAYTRPLELLAFSALTVPKAVGSELLKLLQAAQPLGPDFLHLKRVRASPSSPKAFLQVLVCRACEEPSQRVLDFLSAKGADAGGCERQTVEVSLHAPVTRAQLQEYSATWPLTYRRPALEPLELTDTMREKYRRWFLRAQEVGGDGCGCIILDRSGREVAAARDATDSHPLAHAVMAAIKQVAARRVSGEEAAGGKRPRCEEEYLCQECEVVTTHEPCVMCSMALVHSRVKLVAYREPDPTFGGLGGKISLHTCGPLNHSFRVLRWMGEL